MSTYNAYSSAYDTEYMSAGTEFEQNQTQPPAPVVEIKTHESLSGKILLLFAVILMCFGMLVVYSGGAGWAAVSVPEPTRPTLSAPSGHTRRGRAKGSARGAAGRSARGQLASVRPTSPSVASQLVSWARRASGEVGAGVFDDIKDMKRPVESGGR